MRTQHVESKEIAGVSEALVAKYGAEALRKLIDPRSAGQFAFEYDRGEVRDGSNITTPFSCSRHVADNAKRGWLAVRLVEEHMDGRTGGKWREVETLPDELRVAGEVA